MKTYIHTDLTRFKKGNPNVCIAVIDQQNGQCLRPMPYLTVKPCAKLNIQPGAKIVREISMKRNNSKPHASGEWDLLVPGLSEGDSTIRVMENSAPVLFTVGHSVHSIDHFIEILRMNRIDAVADVRSSPYSKFTPQFNRQLRRKSRKDHGIFYVFMGEELGARTQEHAAYG